MRGAGGDAAIDEADSSKDKSPVEEEAEKIQKTMK